MVSHGIVSGLCAPKNLCVSGAGGGVRGGGRSGRREVCGWLTDRGNVVGEFVLLRERRFQPPSLSVQPPLQSGMVERMMMGVSICVCGIGSCPGTRYLSGASPN